MIKVTPCGMVTGSPLRPRREAEQPLPPPGLLLLKQEESFSSRGAGCGDGRGSWFGCAHHDKAALTTTGKAVLREG